MNHTHPEPHPSHEVASLNSNGQLRWGVLATGGIAGAIGWELKVAGANRAAAASRSLEKAQAFAEQYGFERAYGSYEELYADPDVDIIHIASPHAFHTEQALAALHAGKHVVIEKALTLNRAQAAEIARLAEAKGLLAMEAMWSRYLPHMVRIREIVRSGVLGEIRMLRAEHAQLLSADPAHRLNDLSLGGGALLDLGTYPISFAVDILGLPEEIQAMGRLGETGADTELSLSMRHRGGALSSIFASSRVAGRNTAEILGTAARIEIDATWYQPTNFRVIGTDGNVWEHYQSPIPNGGWRFQLLEAERLIGAGQRDGVIQPLAESVAIMGVFDEIRRQIGVNYPGIDS